MEIMEYGMIGMTKNKQNRSNDKKTSKSFNLFSRVFVSSYTYSNIDLLLCLNHSLFLFYFTYFILFSFPSFI